jgi:hypothetical protein
MRTAGEKLLQILQKRQFPFRSALWLYMPEAEEWRLFLAVPKARKEGKMKFYKQLQSAVANTSTLRSGCYTPTQPGRPVSSRGAGEYTDKVRVELSEKIDSVRDRISDVALQ